MLAKISIFIVMDLVPIHENYYFLLIDDDPDEELILRMALQELPVPVRLDYYADLRAAAGALTTGEIRYPDFVLIGFALPTPEASRMLSSLQAICPPETRIVIYTGLVAEQLFYPLAMQHNSLIMPKCNSLQELKAKLERLIPQLHPGIDPGQQFDRPLSGNATHNDPEPL